MAQTRALVRRAGDGDASAVEALLERHRGRLRKMIRGRMDPRLRQRIDPSDVIQETLITATENLPQYAAEQPVPFYPWLRQIAWQTLVRLHDRHLRAARRTVKRERPLRTTISDESAMGLAERFIGPTSSPSEAAMRGELREQMRRALDELAEDDSEVLLMRYLEQLTSDEIAIIMEISEAAVNMRHMRALERLRRVLNNP